MRSTPPSRKNERWPLGFPTCFHAATPLHYDNIAPGERASRIALSSDQCVIDGQHFFVLGCLDLPILGVAEVFRFLVWVSLSDQNFQRMTELWDIPGREAEPPYFGWFSVLLANYPNMLNLKTSVQTQPVGQRPSIVLEPTEHPLALEQRNGISIARARQISESTL